MRNGQTRGRHLHRDGNARHGKTTSYDHGQRLRLRRPSFQLSSNSLSTEVVTSEGMLAFKIGPLCCLEMR